jgi:1,4-dihydroxy-2-naphthoate octaprenyltransferase
VVRGWITPRRGLLAAALFLALGSALGLWVVSIAGLPVLWIGLAGVAIGILYSAGPFSLKDHAMGDLAVFGTFGVLGALGAWTAQTGSVSWVPALWSVPIALLVSGILHSNNWRDIRSDTDGGVRTVASLLGDRASVAWYAVLLFVPYVLVAGFVGLSALDAMHPAMPPAALAACLSLPLAVRLFRRGLRRHAPDATLDFVALDAATGQLNLVFGLLYTAGFGLAALIGG